jgi:ubiquinol-cytochrome c reductase cytochrome b subunit
LAGFASREWLTGLLDAKQIIGPKYFGGTKFHSGKMAGFVKENLGELDATEKENLKKAVIALSAEAKLPSQRELDAKDAKRIEEGRKALSESFGCTDCHKFHGKGPTGSAPVLDGYGSPEWIAGIIHNPADPHYYNKANDRMPSYAASPDPSQNALNPHQIELLTNWLRGEWYEKSPMPTCAIETSAASKTPGK